MSYSFIHVIRCTQLNQKFFNLVQEGGNIHTIEKSDFLEKSDFFDFWVVRKLPPSCTSTTDQGNQRIGVIEY